MGTRETDLQYIDQHSLKESKMIRKLILCRGLITKSYNIVLSLRSVTKWTRYLMESGIDSRRKKLSWGKNPDRYIPGRCAITITIRNSDSATHIFRKCTFRFFNTESFIYIYIYIYIYTLKWIGSQGDLFFKLFIFLQYVFLVFYTIFRKW